MIATPAGDLPVVFLPATGRGYFLEVASESHHQESLNEKWAEMRPERELSVRLTAEPTNLANPCAVAVQTFGGVALGYLPPVEAARYQQLILQVNAQQLLCCCQAKLVGGTARKPDMALFLDIESPRLVASKLNLSYEPVLHQAPVPGGTFPTEATTLTPSRQRPRSPKKASRFQDLPIEDDAHIDLGSGKGWTVGIVGESRRQTALRNLSAGRRERNEDVNFIVELVPESSNPFDSNAIRVQILGGAQVGYLAREDAAAYRRVVNAVVIGGKKAVCRAKLIGGTPDKPSIGVMIDLLEPNTLLARLGQPF